MFMAALWAYLVVDPLIGLSTAFFGTLNLFVSLFDKVGNAQMVMALAIMLPMPAPVVTGLLWLTIALTVASAVDYLRVGERRLGEWG